MRWKRWISTDWNTVTTRYICGAQLRLIFKEPESPAESNEKSPIAFDTSISFIQLWIIWRESDQFRLRLIRSECVRASILLELWKHLNIHAEQSTLPIAEDISAYLPPLVLAKTVHNEIVHTSLLSFSRNISFFSSSFFFFGFVDQPLTAQVFRLCFRLINFVLIASKLAFTYASMSLIMRLYYSFERNSVLWPCNLKINFWFAAAEYSVEQLCESILWIFIFIAAKT